MPSFKLKSSWVTILQGVEFSIFPLILAWALQQCSATALPVILLLYYDTLIGNDQSQPSVISTEFIAQYIHLAVHSVQCALVVFILQTADNVDNITDCH